MSNLEHKLDQILQKLDALEKKVDSFNTRVFKLENKTSALERNLTAKEETIDILDEKMNKFEKFMLDFEKTAIMQESYNKRLHVFVTSFQLQRVSNLALSVLSSRVSLLFVLLPTRDVSPHNSSQFATSFAFRNLHICIYANLLPFCSAFCQLTAYLFSIFTHSFSDCSLGNCHLFLLSFRTWNNFSHWILLSQLAGKKLFRYVLRLFIVFVLRMYYC